MKKKRNDFGYELPLDTPPHVVEFYKQIIKEKGYTKIEVTERVDAIRLRGVEWNDACTKSND